jgi:uncharacterized membrane protein
MLENTKHNIFIRFIKKVLDPTQYTSIKSLAMLTAIFISIGLAGCLGYAMIADAMLDGVLNMDLIDAGIFVTCLGSFMSIASIPKVLIDKVRAKRGFPYMPEEIQDNEEVDEKED